MKNLRYVIFVGFAIISVASADIETNRSEELGKRYAELKNSAGRIYKDVQITRISDAGISFTHADGSARLRFADLTPEQRKNFGITKKTAMALYTEEMKIRDAYEKRVEEQQAARREQTKKQVAAILEAERMAEEKAQQEQKVVESKVESFVEIPAYPTINRLNTGVLYGSRKETRSYGNYYYGGGYSYPASNGYYPSYYPTRGRCAPAYRSIFHFTIK